MNKSTKAFNHRTLHAQSKEFIKEKLSEEEMLENR